MTKKIHQISFAIVFIAFILPAHLVKAQSPQLDWVHNFGWTGGDWGYAVKSDASGNVYSTGYFKKTVDFDPGPGIFNLTATSDSFDAYVSKLDSGGNFIWAKRIGGSGDDRGWAINIADDGSVYVAGFFASTADFDPNAGVFNLTSDGDRDVFIDKLDADGNFIWAKKLGGTNDDRAISIVTDHNGNVYTSGRFQKTVDFDPGAGVSNLTSNGGNDVFISKLDANGNFIYGKSFGGITDDQSYEIYINNAGDVYCIGYYQNTVDFDPGASVFNLTAVGLTDIFISKLSSEGNFLWAKSIGGTLDDQATGLGADAEGNIYVTGFFRNTADFDPGSGVFNLTSQGQADIFIMKLDDTGDFQWAESIGADTENTGTTLDLDQDGFLYVTGAFLSTVDFNPGAGIYNLKSKGLADVFFLKLNDAGEFQWARSMGGKKHDGSLRIDVDVFGDILTTGFFENTSDFDPDSLLEFNLTSEGNYDAYIHKINNHQCINTASSISITACDSYVLNGITYTESGTFSQSLTNVGGCDSSISLHLIINHCTQTSSSTEACDSYVLNGITYTESGTFSQTFTNAAGCDSTISLHLIINHSTESSSTIEACDSYDLNGITYTESGTFSQTFTNAAGCDSTISLHLIINHST
ncbi:MAG: hypothetical protein LH473_09860, partial [Chitinophagales bacterium]|nr:hypothetical protein [Chitinophagales bacterium]